MDIMQETLRKAADIRDELELRSQATILQWLSRIAENQMLDMHRRLTAVKRDRGREVLRGDGPDDPASGQPAASHLPPDGIAVDREAARLVDECVAELPDDDRVEISLCIYCCGISEWVTA